MNGLWMVEMFHCGNCLEMILEFSYCPYCGTETGYKKERCNKEAHKQKIENNNKFCDICGIELIKIVTCLHCKKEFNHDMEYHFCKTDCAFRDNVKSLSIEELEKWYQVIINELEAKDEDDDEEDEDEDDDEDEELYVDESQRAERDFALESIKDNKCPNCGSIEIGYDFCTKQFNCNECDWKSDDRTFCVVCHDEIKGKVDYKYCTYPDCKKEHKPHPTHDGCSITIKNNVWRSIE